MTRVAAFLLGLACGAAVVAAFGAFASSDATTDVPQAPVPSVVPPRADPPERGGVGRSRRGSVDPLAAIDAGDLPAPESGTGRITGRVLDPQGRGLAGVRVRPVPRDDPPPVSEPPTSDPDEQLRRDLRDVVRRHRWERAAHHEALTDASGTFVVEGLTDRAWRLTPALLGWEFSRTDGESDWEEVRVGAAVAFAAHRVLDVDVAVVRSDGSSPDSAVVIARRDGDRTDVPWRPDASRLQLAAGKWTLTANAGEDDELTSPTVDVEIGESAPPPQRLVLAERPGVIVTLGKGGPQAPYAAFARLMPEEDAALKGASLDDPSGKRARPRDARIAPGGRAAFLDLAAGRWTLSLMNAVGVEFHREAIDVGSGLARRDVPLPARDLRDWVVVRVLDPSGAPTFDVKFIAGFASTNGHTDDEVDATHEGGGLWRVPLLVSGGWSDPSGDTDRAIATRRWLVARSAEWGGTHAEVDSASDAEIVLRFQPPARLSVKIDGAVPDGPTLEVSVSDVEQAEPPNLDGFSERREVASGTVLFGPLPTRRARVVVSMDSSGTSFQLASADVTLAAGENAVALVVPRLQTLRAAAPDGVLPGRVWLLRIESDGWGPWLQRTSTDGGRPEWRNLAPGNYRLWCAEGDMPVAIPGAADVRFVPRPFTCIRIRIEGDSPAYAAGLRHGDLCVALDGTELEGRKQIDAVCYAARLKSKTRLSILRAGQRMDIDVDMSKLELRWDYGGR